ncbi:hypothetical protein [Hamadaea tsunoensis]|uniref:hypothetical protein n=1 Tax=Hamadaea tsunoensis TaxID=53368 RepID=UPI00041E1738|nr:hypothetical protein [Hamadaea tsunoensis]
MHPLVEEAAKKAAVAWLGFGDGPAYAVWCMPLDGKLYIVTGPGEQDVPGLVDAVEAGLPARLTLRGDHGGSIVTFTAEPRGLHGNDTEWETVAPQLAGKRLNAIGTTDEVVARWAAECMIVAITPVAPLAELDATTAAAPPRPTPATRETRRPFRLHRVRGAR